jgi:hypothetical protein
MADHNPRVERMISSNAGTMPCDRPWPKEQVEVYKNWIDADKPR